MNNTKTYYTLINLISELQNFFSKTRINFLIKNSLIDKKKIKIRQFN